MKKEYENPETSVTSIAEYLMDGGWIEMGTNDETEAKKGNFEYDEENQETNPKPINLWDE